MRTPPRAIVLDVVARVFEHRELCDRAVDRALRANPSLSSRERRRVTEAVFALVRFRARLDHQLDAALRATTRRSLHDFATPEQHRLRLALALTTGLGDAVGQAVTESGLDPSLAPAIERATTHPAPWPTDPVAHLATERSIPEWLARRLLAEFGDQADALIDAMNSRAPLTVRTNELKATRDELARRLADEEVATTPGALSPWSLTFDGRPNVFGLEAFRDGLFEAQDEGSQLIALATGARPGETVVDACAGGGGKTLALAAMMKGRGRLVACDVTEARLKDLAPRAKRAGAFNIQPLVVAPDAEGERALQPLAGRADVVLVDAPCSGTGAFRRNPDARWRLTETEADSFPARQLEILTRYSRLVRPGGRLVYATCSLLEAENAPVVARFLETSGFTPERLPLPAEALDDAGRLRLVPHRHGTDGFFAALLRRPAAR